MQNRGRQLAHRAAILMMVLIVGANLMVGCSSESKSYSKDVTKSIDGQTVVVEEETTTRTSESHEPPGILGGAFHLVGEILAFPFEVVAGLLRMIF